MLYIVFGVPGVGKTSVIRGLIEKTGIKHIHWGNLANEIATREGLIENIDELRELSLEKQNRVKKLVVGQIIQEAKTSQGDLLIETHAAIKTPQGFMPGMDMRTIQELDPDVFIVIQAKPEIVFQRRLLDESRQRKDDLTIEEVNESLSVTRQMAQTYAVLASGTVFFVENKEDQLEYAIEKLEELIVKGRVGDGELGAI